MISYGRSFRAKWVHASLGEGQSPGTLPILRRRLTLCGKEICVYWQDSMAWFPMRILCKHCSRKETKHVTPA
jgi:hypothetical protein